MSSIGDALAFTTMEEYDNLSSDSMYMRRYSFPMIM